MRITEKMDWVSYCRDYSMSGLTCQVRDLSTGDIVWVTATHEGRGSWGVAVCEEKGADPGVYRGRSADYGQLSQLEAYRICIAAADLAYVAYLGGDHAAQ